MGISKLDEFADKHGDVRGQLASWLQEAKQASWKTPSDIKARYSTASFLADNKIIFNLKGNNYRMEVIVAYRSQIVMIRRLGTLAEYSRWSN